MQKFILSCATAALIAFSCHSPSAPVNTKEIRLNLHSDPPVLDPRKATDTSSISVIRTCFDGLMRRDEQGNRSMAIAKAVDISEDGCTYIFYLKETKWSDGEPLTAQDFESAWKAMLDPQFLCEFANELYVIKNGQKAKENRASLDEVGIKSLSPYVLQVQLENPAPYFLDMLVTHIFLPMPSHIVNKNPQWAKKPESYISNGPFCLTEWKHYNTITLEKNEQYWDKEAVSLEKIKMYMVEDESTALSMYENDEIEWVGSPLSGLPSDALPILSTNKEFHTYAISGVYYYIFNTKRFPFNNKHMRRAFALAVHRQEIIDNVLQGKQTVATSFVPPTMWNLTRSYFADADAAAAKKEFALGLKELKIEAKDLPPIKLSYNTNSGHHKIAQAIQEQWSSTLGVKVELENMEWKVFLDNTHAHKFQMARMGGIASYNDPVSLLKDYQYDNTRLNPAQWGNAKFSELMELSDKTQDPEKRFKIISDAEAILIEEMPIIPIYFYTGSYMKKPYVKSVNISVLNDMDFKYTHMEKR